MRSQADARNGRQALAYGELPGLTPSHVFPPRAARAYRTWRQAANEASRDGRSAMATDVVGLRDVLGLRRDAVGLREVLFQSKHHGHGAGGRHRRLRTLGSGVRRRELCRSPCWWPWWPACSPRPASRSSPATCRRPARWPRTRPAACIQRWASSSAGATCSSRRWCPRSCCCSSGGSSIFSGVFCRLRLVS